MKRFYCRKEEYTEQSQAAKFVVVLFILLWGQRPIFLQNAASFSPERFLELQSILLNFVLWNLFYFLFLFIYLFVCIFGVEGGGRKLLSHVQCAQFLLLALEQLRGPYGVPGNRIWAGCFQGKHQTFSLMAIAPPFFL